ncbi:hypothetical protein ED312_02810 [Sinomicrobium pectinilyticum]|uniref:Uncharacterized protein n=1 Tax=Sinomicrobium pectinilyticum TaxID=1084421 RepID=A0A3N0EZS2_SINP1|nr:hypothetical protein [Sinomicrobium pectinilyticum]RNL93393.1 hypothetical protein ED312_02810 [Sinomicrobium pectinilyticum]
MTKFSDITDRGKHETTILNGIPELNRAQPFGGFPMANGTEYDRALGAIAVRMPIKYHLGH